MICPVFVASDLSARPTAVWAEMVAREGEHALSAGGPGAGHDNSRSDAAGDEWRDQLDAGGRAQSELQSRGHLVCRLLLEKKKKEAIEQAHHVENRIQ